jgi:serine/threonine protein kinase/formylglycine-generating enzyme required for sulfatase activity
MITFACASCHKKLSVKDELAGRTGRCPGCGKPVAIPATKLAGAVAEGGKAVLPPEPPPRVDPTRQPSAPVARDASDGPTLAPGLAAAAPQRPDSAPDETVAGEKEAAGERAAELTDFLAPSQQPDEIGRLGPYRVLAVLGAGGMGVVYRAEDPGLQRLVALKAMLPSVAVSPTARQRFVREARTAASISHDNIVHIYQVGEDRGVPFIAMQFLDGESLDARLLREGKLSVTETMRIGREIAEGLGAAHDRGQIHRDIKPANIWLETRSSLQTPWWKETGSDGGRVKILDFGLARASAEDSGLTQQGAIIGTPSYMAPEQGRGEKVDARSDLWSLGVVMYRMCTGRLPFKGPDTVATLMAVAMQEPPSPAALDPEIPPGLSELVMKLLAKEPGQRFASAGQLVQSLRQLEQTQHGTQVLETRPSKAPPRQSKVKGVQTPRAAAGAPATMPVRKGRKGLVLALGGVVAAVAVAAGVLLWLRPHGTGSTEPTTEAPRPGLADLPPKYTNHLGMEFVRVPRGKSWLSPVLRPVRPGVPAPVPPAPVEVEILDDFYLGAYEVTQEEWEKVMGNNPSHFSRSGSGRDAVKEVRDDELKRFPVENVSYHDVEAFLKELNRRENETGWVYRLPKEYEWEYACRGGPMTDKLDAAFDFYFDKPTKQLLPEQANYQHGKSLKRTCKVGSYPPNRLGLFDMHGNVREWCDDLLIPGGVGRPGPRVGRPSPSKGSRGGSWDTVADLNRAGHRYVFGPGTRNTALGLRVAIVPMID